MNNNRGAAMTAWVDDERLARAAWSVLAESTDLTARKLRASLGVQEALQVALSQSAPPSILFAGDTRAHRQLVQARERWAVRVGECSPERDLDKIASVGGDFITPAHPHWPWQLDDLGAHAPVGLWVRGEGDLAALTARSMALVGSRAATRYGQLVCSEFASDLAAHGFTIISGAAIGVDVAAHRAALGAGTPTVAVLACGADQVYPPGHANLLARIAQDGVVASELPPGSTPTRYRFLERNRIIAALASATIVIEAAWRSGALNTARLAAELNRPLGAVPGPVTTPTSAGCHKLIRSGQATLVSDATEAAELALSIGAIEPSTPRGHRAAHDGLEGAALRVWEALPVAGWASSAEISRLAGVSEADSTQLLTWLLGVGRAEQKPQDDLWRRPRQTSAEAVYGLGSVPEEIEMR